MKRIIAYVILIVMLSTFGTLGLIEAKTREDSRVIVNSNEIIISSDKTKDSKYELIVNLYDDAKCESDCQKLVKIKTETPFAKELAVKHYANYVLIYDGVIKLIDVNKKQEEVISMTYKRSDNYSINLEDESETIILNSGKDISSIVSSNSNNMIYYDYSNGQVYESESYDSMISYNDYFLANSEGNVYLLDYRGVKLIQINKDINIDNLQKITVDSGIYAFFYSNSRNKTFVVYDSTGKEIMKRSGSYNDIELMDDNIYVYEPKRLVTYNHSGKITKLVDIEGYELKYAYKNYMFSIKDGNLISYNVSNDDTTLITNMSDKEIESISYKDEDNKPGIYMVFKDSLNNSFGLYYNLDNKMIENFNLV